MEFGLSIHIVMHSILSLKSGVTHPLMEYVKLHVKKKNKEILWIVVKETHAKNG